MIGKRKTFAMFVSGVMLGIAIAGCGGGSGSGSGRVANPTSSELFDRAYGYLVRGDADFTRFAPNYSNLRPFTRDTALVVATKSEYEKAANPSGDYLEHFYLRVHRAMSVRMIVADSTGQGLITYEFGQLKEGEYTVGTKGWPTPQIERVKGNPFVYVYFVGDQRFRTRYKLGLDEKNHLTFMPQPTLPG